MNISNFLSNAMQDQGNDFSNRRLARLEKHRDRLDQTFDSLQQQAIEEGDSEKAQKIFEISEMIEDKLDTRLDKLEKKTGEFNWNRHLDNAFDKLQAKAYENDDAETAESAFALSQMISGGELDSSKQSLLDRFLTDTIKDSTTKSTSSTDALGDGKLQALLQYVTQTSATNNSIKDGVKITDSTTETTDQKSGSVS